VKIKTDENIGHAGIRLLRDAGHDVVSVHEQGLSGAPDQTIFDVCATEARTLITLDRDFGQVPRFPPTQTAGVVILELGGPASLDRLLSRLREFLALAARRAVVGELWIVEPGRVRVRLTRDRDSEQFD
jgi:predicted nuclease of predicted toxin-antitoxin system